MMIIMTAMSPPPVPDPSRCYTAGSRYCDNEDCLGESAYQLGNFTRFLEGLEPGDDRPVWVFDFFERLDESVDVAPFIEALDALERPVYLALGAAVGRIRLGGARYD